MAILIRGIGQRPQDATGSLLAETDSVIPLSLEHAFELTDPTRDWPGEQYLFSDEPSNICEVKVGLISLHNLFSIRNCNNSHCGRFIADQYSYLHPPDIRMRRVYFPEKELL